MHGETIKIINAKFVFDTFFFGNYDLLGDNVKKVIVEPDRPQMTIWRMHIACWIRKATNKH